jgi:hypothetical protein
MQHPGETAASPRRFSCKSSCSRERAWSAYSTRFLLYEDSIPKGDNCNVQSFERYNASMKGRVMRSVMVSLEWRVFAFIITNIFLWITTGEFWTAAGLALTLQIILFVAYVIWHFLRNELHVPLVPPRLHRRR